MHSMQQTEAKNCRDSESGVQICTCIYIHMYTYIAVPFSQEGVEVHVVEDAHLHWRHVF